MAESVRSARWLGALRAGLLAACLAASAQAQQAAPPPAPQQAEPLAADPALESRVMALSAELRCLVCQNQTIADSNADLAVDLREQVREMLGRGMSDDEIRSYMTDRYGDFVLYNPPLKASTAVLWAGPAVLLVVAVAALLLVLRRRQRLAADAFDPEIPEDDDPPGANR